MQIAVLFRKIDEGIDLSCYTIHHIAEFWRARGLNVVYVFGVEKHVPADLIIVHIDFSIVPQEYIDYAANYPIALNAQLRNVCKSEFSESLLEPDSDWDGKVIVKSNLNHGGIQEQIHRAALNQPSLDVYRRAVSKAKRMMGWEPQFLDPYDYKIFDDVSRVPRPWFRASNAIIEKFLPEIDDDLYHIRMFQVLGDHWVCERLASPDPIVKGGNCIDVESVEPEKEVFEWRNRLKLDYGKLDYVVINGKPILLDINKTTGATGLINKKENDKKRRHLSEGIFSYFEKSGPD